MTPKNDPPTAEPPTGEPPLAAPVASAGPWQAIFSPEHNAYYFFNSVSQETTWTNPLQPDSASSGATSSSTTPASDSPQPEAGPSTVSSSHAALQAAAIAAGI